MEIRRICQDGSPVCKDVHNLPAMIRGCLFLDSHALPFFLSYPRRAKGRDTMKGTEGFQIREGDCAL
jgi:hypothetical protein